LDIGRIFEILVFCKYLFFFYYIKDRTRLKKNEIHGVFDKSNLIIFLETWNLFKRIFKFFFFINSNYFEKKIKEDLIFNFLFI